MRLLSDIFQDMKNIARNYQEYDQDERNEYTSPRKVERHNPKRAKIRRERE